LSEKDIENMIADAEKYFREDEELNQKVKYKSLLEETIFTVQSKVAETNHHEKELADLMDWLELDSDSSSLEEMKQRGRMIEDTWGIIVSS